MYCKFILSLLAISLAVIAVGQAQTRPEQLTNRAFLQSRAVEWRKELIAKREKAYLWAQRRQLPIIQVLPDGTIISLQKLDENGQPVYYATDFNTRAAATTRTDHLWTGGSLGLHLSGSSAYVAGKLGLWDGGPVRTSHRELTSRVVQQDAGAVIDPGVGTTHATHVAGTLMASGVHALAKGMAFGYTQLHAYDFSNDQAEMAAEAANLLVSNHSYGTVAGWRINPNRAGTATDPQWEWFGDVNVSTTEDWRFGFYNSDARRWDEITFNAPYYLPVKSAGNFRNQNGPAVGQPFWQRNNNGIFELLASRPEGINSNNGYDIITTYATAKNVLTVGGVDPISKGYNQPSDIRISSFSSWGPTDDGRIKPDVVANGIAVFSLASTNDSAYTTLNGTSMATPNVAGTLLLLQEYYASLHAEAFMRAATLKGLVIHTADEAGTAPGPDYVHGWGLLNAQKAAQVIANADHNHLIEERILMGGGTYSLSVVASGKGPLVVTLSWTDPPGTALTPNTANLNNRTPRLVNDLDLRITDGAGNYLPWTLHPDTPAHPATPGDNIRDNVEQIMIPNVVPGQAYTIRISHKGTLQKGSQAYSLLASGVGGSSYCVSSGSSAGSRIERVRLGTLDNASSTECAAYTNFTGLSTDLSPGQTLPITVTAGSCDASSNNVVKIFVDWNGDFDFDDSNELVATSGIMTGKSSFSNNVSVPAGVSIGHATRLRVVCVETIDAATVNACGTSTQGETEDYTIRFIRPQTDVAAGALLFPEASLCPNSAQAVVVAIKNMGRTMLTGVPVQVNIMDQNNSMQMLYGNFSDTLEPFAEAQVTLPGTFAAIPGGEYTFVVKVNEADDQNRSNDSITVVRMASSAVATPAATAAICADEVLLRAEGEGTTYWYDAPLEGNLVAVGNMATTTVKPANATYYAATNDFSGKIGPATKQFATGGGYNQFSPSILITTQVPLLIESARLYVGHAGRIIFTLETASGLPITSSMVEVAATRNPAGSGALPDVASDTGKVYLLNLVIPEPGNYRISVSYENGATLFRNNTGVSGYPFTIPGVIAITGNTATTDPASYYYYLYDIKVKALGCASPRVAAVASTSNDPAPAAVLSGGGTICAGDSALVSVHLTGTPPWSLSYSNGSALVSIQGITHSPYTFRATQTGTYSITALSDAKSCSSFKVNAKVTVTAKAAPTATIQVNHFTLTASEGVLYRWFRNDTLLPQATDQQLIAYQPGNYQVEVTDSAGCSARSKKVVVSSLLTSNQTPLIVAPNPVREHIVLKSPNFLPPIQHVRLVSVLGQTVKTWSQINTINQKQVQFDWPGLSSGTYILMVETDSRIYTYRISKQ